MEKRINEKLVLFVALVLTSILVMISRAYACNHYSEWDDTCMLCEQREYLMDECYYEFVRSGREGDHFMINPTDTGFRMKSVDTKYDFDFFFDMVHNEVYGQNEGEVVKGESWYWWEELN